MRAPDLHGLYNAKTRHRIINAQLEGCQKSVNVLYNLICPLVLNEAVLHRNNLTGPCAVHAADRMSLAVQSENTGHLVAIAVGILHPDHRLYRPEDPNALLHPGFLFQKLLLHRKINHGAAAAF